MPRPKTKKKKSPPKYAIGDYVIIQHGHQMAEARPGQIEDIIMEGGFGNTHVYKIKYQMHGEEQIEFFSEYGIRLATVENIKKLKDFYVEIVEQLEYLLKEKKNE